MKIHIHTENTMRQRTGFEEDNQYYRKEQLKRKRMRIIGEREGKQDYSCIYKYIQ